MTPLSAADAIGPAWQRMREVLFARRSFRLFFKLAAVATLAEISNGVNLRVGNSHVGSIHEKSPVIASIFAAIVTAIVAIVIVGLLIGLAIFYCGSRMQLAMVDIVADKATSVGPLWRKYGSVVWRWIGLKILVIVSFFVVLAAIALPFVLYFVLHFGVHGRGIGSASGGMTATVVLGIVVLVLVFTLLILAFVAIFSLIIDFVPAFMALENTSISESLRRVRAICRYEPGQVVLYLLLRLVLGIAIGLGFILYLLFAALIACIPLGGVGFGLYAALHKGGAAAHGVLIAAAFLGCVLFLVWMLFVYICAAGTIATFFRAYALYFLGGRFFAVGDMLDRSTPPPAYLFPQGYAPLPVGTPPAPPAI